MGVIQSAINSALGDVSRLAALKKIKDNTDESLKIQEKSQEEKEKDLERLRQFFPDFKSDESMDEYLKRHKIQQVEATAKDSMAAALDSKAKLNAVKRRNFARDYLPQMDTSLGGKVGQFDKPTQKKIASNFSQAQRKEIMDRMDAEAKEKKNGIKK